MRHRAFHWKGLGIGISIAAPLAAIALIPVNAPAQAPAIEAPARIEVRAEAITSFDPRDPDRRHFGSLAFRGGLVLTSPEKHFGGLSGLAIASDGIRFLAVSDRARWFRGRIVYDGNRPAAIADVEMAPVLGPDGRPLAQRGWYDTEALAEDHGTIYVGIERVQRILRFDYAKDGLRARGQPVPTPRELADLPRNKGIECLAVAPKDSALAGSLIVISEQGLDSSGHIRGFLIGGSNAGEFTVRRDENYDVSDCAVTPRGDLIVLQRQFSWRTGLVMRMRRVPLAQVRPSAVIEGELLIEADLGYQIDNMEGLSVHRDASGALVLTLVSDDNFSLIQRTILLQFALVD